MWRRGGVQELTFEEPQWPVDVLWIPHLPRPPRKTYQWDRIQTSEVESQWCPVMRGWTGGSGDWQCQKQQIDPAERGLMIWNRLLQFAGLQWLRVAQSQLNGQSVWLEVVSYTNIRDKRLKNLKRHAISRNIVFLVIHFLLHYLWCWLPRKCEARLIIGVIYSGKNMLPHLVCQYYQYCKMHISIGSVK